MAGGGDPSLARAPPLTSDTTDSTTPCRNRRSTRRRHHLKGKRLNDVVYRGVILTKKLTVNRKIAVFSELDTTPSTTTTSTTNSTDSIEGIADTRAVQATPAERMDASPVVGKRWETVVDAPPTIKINDEEDDDEDAFAEDDAVSAADSDRFSSPDSDRDARDDCDGSCDSDSSCCSQRTAITVLDVDEDARKKSGRPAATAAATPPPPDVIMHHNLNGNGSGGRKGSRRRRNGRRRSSAGSVTADGDYASEQLRSEQPQRIAVTETQAATDVAAPATCPSTIAGAAASDQELQTSVMSTLQQRQVSFIDKIASQFFFFFFGVCVYDPLSRNFLQNTRRIVQFF